MYLVINKEIWLVRESMVRGSYCQQVMTFFYFFGLQLTARLKLQFQSGTLFLKVWIRPWKHPIWAVCYILYYCPALKPGRVILVIRVTFSPGHPGLTRFTIYPGLTRIVSREKRNCSFDDVELINAIA